ncbi:hypothetical protein D3C85_1353190 [compost metagenome]
MISVFTNIYLWSGAGVIAVGKCFPDLGQVEDAHLPEQPIQALEDRLLHACMVGMEGRVGFVDYLFSLLGREAAMGQDAPLEASFAIDVEEVVEIGG